MGEVDSLMSETAFVSFKIPAFAGMTAEGEIRFQK